MYAETVLEPIFEDFKKFFLGHLLDVHYAHAKMLARQGIISAADESSIRGALNNLNIPAILATKYDGSYEDCFFYIESLIEGMIGVDVAGKLHTARSRNDVAITLYRMMARRKLLAAADSIATLRGAILRTAADHVETVMPAYTHTQPAQPTTLAHYLMAAAEFLDRDSARLREAYGHVNLCPMGACAITTTGFPIDRDLTAGLLGFAGLAENSYGAIASIDYLTGTAAVIAVAAVNLGKFAQDLLLWSTREFGFLRLSGGYVQSSSIMPQKRNPVALEHVRILLSRSLGEALGVLTAAHNTPFGDINDSEDNLQPLVNSMFTDFVRASSLLAGTLSSASVDREKLAAQARRGFIAVTELADVLVRKEGLSFRQAHHLVARAVAECGTDDAPITMAKVLMRLRPELRCSQQNIEDALDPWHFVQVRTIKGGPAGHIVSEALERANQSLSSFSSWTREQQLRLDKASNSLRE